ncbi:MAG: class I SAM-dependent methyltransferase [Bdellovibrionales bacterium]
MVAYSKFRYFKNPSKYAPFSYPKERLTLQHEDAQNLSFKDNQFDFVFSFSSIEHFGSRETIEKSMREIQRVLKPGGYAVISTELIVNDAQHSEYFSRTELSKHMIESHEMQLLDNGNIDFSISESTASHVSNTKHMHPVYDLVYNHDGVIFQPIQLVFKKQD